MSGSSERPTRAGQPGQEPSGTAAKTSAAKKSTAKTSAAKKSTAKKGSGARPMTRDEKLRKLMRGKGFPHPDFRTGGATFRVLTPQEAAEAMEQATREIDPDYRDEADVAQAGERELTEAEQAPTSDEVSEIAEYEAARAGGPHA